MEQVRIRLEGISKSYYAKTAVTQALRKINLTFRMGEFVAITGESGSGKSTLLNIIGGMDTFDDGEMFVDGEATGNLDEQNTLRTMSILKTISKECLVILVTHEKRIARFFADRIIEIRDGEVYRDVENRAPDSYERMDEPIFI